MYQQINLYQPIFRKERHLLSALTMAQAAGLLIVTLLVIYGYAAWKVVGLEAEVRALELREQADAQRVQRLDLGSDAERRAEVEAELRDLNVRLIEEQRLLQALGDQRFGATRGFSPRLTALAHTRVEGLWLTRVALSGAQGAMRLSGESLFAGLVPEYLQRLSEEPALKGAGFAKLEIERIPENGRVAFQVSSRTLLEETDPGRFASVAP